jgi:NADPH-dependent curcumin reductase CurA
MSTTSESIRNRAFRLRHRPVGEPAPSDLELVEEAVGPVADGEVLVRTLYLSLDPTNRLWMSDMRQYSPPVELGAVMRGIGIGEVVESRREDMQVGDLVFGYTQWQEYCVAGPEAGFSVLPSPLPAPLTAFLGALGHTGLTAYIGLEMAELQPGETLVVSAAGGAVGSVVGQIAKARGARAVGIAGGAEKCRHAVEELGFDACVDRLAPGWREALDAATPDGVDVNFENVGGEIMDHVFMRLNMNARVILCGMISQYDAAGAQYTWQGQVNVGQILMQRATMRGFIVSDHVDQFAAGAAYLAGLLAAGRLKYDETIVEGFEQAPVALHKLFTGEKLGKLLVHVADPSPNVA